LADKFQEVSGRLYKQASAGAARRPDTTRPGSGAAPVGLNTGAGARGGNGDVVDAEFEVVDEDKKK